MMNEGFDADSPIYLQLAERVNRKILRGELQPGEKLPSVREMALQSGVNPNTVQRTYSELERMGVVEVRRGQGTFITNKKERLDRLREEMRHEKIADFVRAMEAMGFSPEEILLGLEEYLKHDLNGGMKSD